MESLTERSVIALGEPGEGGALYAASLQSDTAAWVYRRSPSSEPQSPAAQLEIRRHADGKSVWLALHSAVADGFLAAPNGVANSELAFLHSEEIASEDSALWKIEGSDGTAILLNKAGGINVRVRVEHLPKRDALYDLEGPAPHISAELEKQYQIEPLPPPEQGEPADAQAEAQAEQNNAEWLSRWLQDDEALLSSVRPLTTEEAIARAQPSITKTLSSRLMEAGLEDKEGTAEANGAASAGRPKSPGRETAAAGSSASTAGLPAATADAVDQVQKFLRELRDYDELVLELGHLEQVEHERTRELAGLKAAYAEVVGEVDVLQRDIASAKMEMELAVAAHAPDDEVLPASVITHLYALGGRAKGADEKQSDEDFIREERERHFHELKEMEEVAEGKHQEFLSRKEECEETMRDAVTVREEIGRLSEKLAQVKEAHEQIIAQIAAMRGSRSGKGEALKGKKREYDALLAEAKSLRQQFAADSEALDAKRTEHDKLLAIKDGLQKAYEQLANAPPGTKVSLPTDGRLAEALASLGTDLSGLSPAELHKQASQEVATRLQVRRGELEATARKVTGLRLLILAKNDELQARRTEYEALVAELQDGKFKEAAQEKYQELAAAKQVYDMLAGHVVTLRSVLREIRKAVEKQKEGLEECAIERAQLKAAVQKKQAELGFPVEKLNTLKDALRARTRDLEEKREALQRASGELAELRERIETLAGGVRAKRGLRNEREAFVSNLVSLLAAVHSPNGAPAAVQPAALEAQIREIKQWLTRTAQLDAALQATPPAHWDHGSMQRLEAALRRAPGAPHLPNGADASQAGSFSRHSWPRNRNPEFLAAVAGEGAPEPAAPAPAPAKASSPAAGKGRREIQNVKDTPAFDRMDEEQLEKFIEATRKRHQAQGCKGCAVCKTEKGCEACTVM